MTNSTSASFQAEFNDLLHPFYFTTTRDGAIQHAGKSLKKCFPDLPVGTPFREAFEVLRPNLEVQGGNPADYVGELILLNRDGIRLRGQVLPLPGSSSEFIFSVTPAITEMRELRDWNLDFSDFPPGDPIFDFLMLLQSQHKAHARTRQALQNLEWQHRLSQLLHQLALRTQEESDAASAYQATLDAVTETLGFHIGHVYEACRDETHTLRSTGIWSKVRKQGLLGFQEATMRTTLKPGMGLTSRAHETGKVIWIDDLWSDPHFLRRSVLEGTGIHFGVAAPIQTEGRISAVLEFFSSAPPHPEAKRELIPFFETLCSQLSRVIERQAILQREHARIAQLAHASKMATLGELAAGIAHEINNPLAAITLGTEHLFRLVKDPRTSGDVRQASVARIQRSVDRIAKIVSGLRMFSRESSHDPFTPTPIADIILETLDLCQARFQSIGVELRIDTLPKAIELPCRASQISQVILNLLNNALDAVEPLEERWVAMNFSQDAETFTISITDSGNGIPEAVARKIMNPFFTTKPPGKGTGLGLSICSNILIDHGGRLELDTTCPHTTFRMRLPLVRGAETAKPSHHGISQPH
jgi:C4-dicarboxylate-specific signal transduction histidine kinase